MKFTVRLAGPEESDAFARTFWTALVQPSPTEAQLEMRRPGYLSSRSFAAYEGKEIVGTAAAWPFDMVVPGGGRVVAAGVTAVGVMPTHTRRGILTSLMRTQLEDAAEIGQPVAILGATESIIYGRFGYGLATTAADITIETDHGAFAQPFEDPGRLRLITRAEALEMFPAVFEQHDRDRAGSINRPPVRWAHPRMYGAIPEGDPTPPEIYVLHEDPKGKPDGGMAYEILDRASWWEKPGYVEVHDLFGSPSAYVALWRYLLDIDLVRGVKAGMRPPDEPVRWMLADPRRLQMKLEDQLWLRVLDVASALTARTYGRPGRLVLDVADPFLGLGGRFELDADEAGAATCKPVRRAADLEMTIADLGAVYLGGASFTALAAAGRVVERRAGALARADQLFAHHPLPWCSTFF